MKDEREASGERTTLPQEYDSAYLEDGNTAPTETLTVFFDDPDQYLTKGSSSIRRGEAIQQIKKGLSMATAGVLPQHTMRQEYVVYDSSQVRSLQDQQWIRSLVLRLSPRQVCWFLMWQKCHAAVC